MCESEDVFIGTPERIMYQIIVRTQQGSVAMFFYPIIVCFSEYGRTVYKRMAQDTVYIKFSS